MGGSGEEERNGTSTDICQEVIQLQVEDKHNMDSFKIYICFFVSRSFGKFVRCSESYKAVGISIERYRV